MHRLTLTLTLVLLPLVRVGAQQAAPGDTTTSPVIHGRAFSTGTQGTAAVRTPIHELTPFIQVGKTATGGTRTEFLFGIAHPLAPYKLHFP